MDIKTEEKQKRIHIIISLLAVLIIAIQAGLSWKLFWEPVQKLFSGNSGLVETAETITSNYISDLLPGKNWYITINGLFARLTGRRRYNKVTIMKNGMLTGEAETEFEVQLDKSAAEWIAPFLSDLKEKGIASIFVQTPIKEPYTESLLPSGLHDNENVKMDNFLAILDSKEVNTLDLRPLLSATREDVERNFYRTDGHWNADGAMTAFREIVLKLARITQRNLDLSFIDDSKWMRYEKEDWWLGNKGRRVGALFAGTDSLIWYLPIQEQEISCAIPSKNKFTFGDFSDTCVYSKYINDRDLFGLNNYWVYGGSNYPMVEYRNLEAPNAFKVLILGDSFSLPINAFMSTVFSRVDCIDPRYYTASSISEYISWTKPDAVILIRRVPTIEQLYGAEIEEYTDPIINWETVYQCDEVTLEASKNKRYNTAKVETKLERGKTYHISFDEICVIDGETRGVSVLLYEKTKKQVIWSTIMDIDYCQAKEDFSWSFSVPKEKGKYELRLCAGLYGKTRGVGVVYKDVVVSLDNQE